MDDPKGPYQDIPIFNGVFRGSHIAYFQNKIGCSITPCNVDSDILEDDLLAFFTPNGAGMNGFCNFDLPSEKVKTIIEVIFIFDRFGRLFDQLPPNDVGWDGKIQQSTDARIGLMV